MTSQLKVLSGQMVILARHCPFTSRYFEPCDIKWTPYTGKNNGFPFLDIFGYLKNTHKNPKFGKVRQVPTREFPTKFPDWDLAHSSKFGIFVGIPYIPQNIQKWESIIFSCDINQTASFLACFFFQMQDLAFN